MKEGASWSYLGRARPPFPCFNKTQFRSRLNMEECHYGRFQSLNRLIWKKTVLCISQAQMFPYLEEVLVSYLKQDKKYAPLPWLYQHGNVEQEWTLRLYSLQGICATAWTPSSVCSGNMAFYAVTHWQFLNTQQRLHSHIPGNTKFKLCGHTA